MRTHQVQAKARGVHQIQRIDHRTRERGAPALPHTPSASGPLSSRQISDLFRRWPLINELPTRERRVMVSVTETR